MLSMPRVLVIAFIAAQSEQLDMMRRGKLDLPVPQTKVMNMWAKMRETKINRFITKRGGDDAGD